MHKREMRPSLEYPKDLCVVTVNQSGMFISHCEAVFFLGGGRGCMTGSCCWLGMGLGEEFSWDFWDSQPLLSWIQICPLSPLKQQPSRRTGRVNRGGQRSLCFLVLCLFAPRAFFFFIIIIFFFLHVLSYFRSFPVLKTIFFIYFSSF